MNVNLDLDGWPLAIMLLVLLVALIAFVAGGVWVGLSIRRSQLALRRERLLTAFCLPEDSSHNEVVSHYLRLVWRAKDIGFLVAGVATVAVLVVADGHAHAGTWDAMDARAPLLGGQLAAQYALWYTGYLVGGAIGAAAAMHLRGRHRARASLAARDVTSFVPRACVRATFVIGPIAAVGALASLFVGSPDWYERMYLGVALGVAVLAMAVMIPLANRLAQMRMPVDVDRDPVLDEAFRQVSARMVAGDAVLMVTAALAVVGALLMPTDQAALVAFLVLLVPAGIVARALQPGEYVPRYLLRWLDSPPPSRAR